MEVTAQVHSPADLPQAQASPVLAEQEGTWVPESVRTLRNGDNSLAHV